MVKKEEKESKSTDWTFVFVVSVVVALASSVVTKGVLKETGYDGVVTWFTSPGASEGGASTPIVNTACGTVKGVVEDGVNVYKGIPYAQPPQGELRWRPTVPLRPKSSKGACWKEPFQATEFGSACAQNDAFTGNPIGSEDCLFLNVWSPTNDPNAKLPVIVWIHGGYFMFASGHFPGYAPTPEVAREMNAVVVSMNYRVNVFGFMALKMLKDKSDPTHANFGFLDQIEALKWVKENIAAFGGDPNLVTVMGNSAGGGSVIVMTTSPLAKGLFHRAWCSSGSVLMEGKLDDAEEANKIFLERLKCKDAKCLRSRSVDELLAELPTDVYPYYLSSFFTDLPELNEFAGPLCPIDGHVIPMSLTDAYSSRQFNDVSLLVSYTAQEIGFSPAPADLKSWDWAQYDDHVRQKLGTFDKKIANEALSLYGHQKDPEYTFTTMGSDVRVTCMNQRLIDLARKASKSPIYHMVIPHCYAEPHNPVGFPFKPKYATHLIDIAAFFGYSEINVPNPKNLRREDVLFQRQLRDNIGYFARHGKMRDVEWESNIQGVAIFDHRLMMNQSYQKKGCDFWIKNNFLEYGWCFARDAKRGLIN